MSNKFSEFMQHRKEIATAIEDGTVFLESEKVTTITPEIVKRVYHRDYMKTKDKPYRKYKADKRKKSKSRETS